MRMPIRTRDEMKALKRKHGFSKLAEALKILGWGFATYEDLSGEHTDPTRGLLVGTEEWLEERQLELDKVQIPKR